MEYEFLPEASLPAGHLAPKAGGRELEPMQNFAICQSEGFEYFYLLCCTSDRRYMTYSFGDSKAEVKNQLVVEFGKGIDLWHPMK
jgi:hypothetical protein